jgi:hypothetical protein
MFRSTAAEPVRAVGFLKGRDYGRPEYMNIPIRITDLRDKCDIR